MNTGARYSLKHFILWTRHTIYWLAIMAAVPVLLYEFANWHWIAIPWVTIALIGTAAAFIAGFKNTQSYNRTWEARTIWGGIVNSSRAWGMIVKDFVRHSDATEEKKLHRELVYRHIAWLTALRFQLRESRSWENVKTKKYNREYLAYYTVDEWVNQLDKSMEHLLPAGELAYVMSKKNRATQLIALQSKQLRALNENGQLETLRYVEMENLLKEMYDHQGRSERIKNYPYPRQFASINIFFILLLVVLLPFGLLNEFAKLGQYGIWLTIPFTVIVGWVFTSLEQVGESTENPFEGSANDIPITSMSRTIEIDLREMLDEENIPAPIVASNNILM